jgi:Protein of unknown function (DUF1800)
MTGAASLVVLAPGLFDAAQAATPVAGLTPALLDKKKKKSKPKPKPKPKPPSIGAVEHMLRRTTYGATPAMVTAVRKLGLNGWLNEQLNPGRINDSAMDKLAARWVSTYYKKPSLGLSIAEIWNDPTRNNGSWNTMNDLTDVHIARAAWSKRQLFEIMVDFWSNHLNITCPSSNVWDSRHVWDRQVIRAHTLGKFSDMLVASGTAPAMLNYLGNAVSDGHLGYPNENWGRELLELHTVGLGAHYTQNDVHNSALILSGLSVSNQTGGFLWIPEWHYTGHVKVMGFEAHTNASNGQAVAKSYLRYLAHHPKTANLIAHKLAVRFVSDTPPASLVSALAKTYLKHGTAIKPVLMQLLTSSAFHHAVGHKVRTPYEDLIATIRVLRIGPSKYDIAGIQGLKYTASAMGQMPLAWALPNGYADVASAWSATSTTVGKWNTHLQLTQLGSGNDLQFTPLINLLPANLPANCTYGRLMGIIAGALNLPALNATQSKAIVTFLGKSTSDVVVSTDPVLSWRLPNVMALMLNSSHQAER